MTSVQETLSSWDLFEIKDKELLNFLVGREGGKTSILICAHDYITAERFEKSVFYYPSEKFNNIQKEYRLLKKYLLNR